MTLYLPTLVAIHATHKRVLCGMDVYAQCARGHYIPHARTHTHTMIHAYIHTHVHQVYGVTLDTQKRADSFDKVEGRETVFIRPLSSTHISFFFMYLTTTNISLFTFLLCPQLDPRRDL